MGNFIRENTAKRETAGREKQSSPLKSNLPKNFLLLCTRLLTREQFSQIPGAFVGSFWCPSNSLLFQPQGSRGGQGTAPRWTQGYQQGQGEGGQQVTPHLPGTTPQHCQRAPGHELCVPRDRSSSVSRWELAFSSFYSCPQN